MNIGEQKKARPMQPLEDPVPRREERPAPARRSIPRKEPAPSPAPSPEKRPVKS